MRKNQLWSRAQVALLCIAMAVVGVAVLPSTSQAATKAPTYYVSLGDSYSIGYQPGLGATSGYTGYVAQKTHLTLANFGCGGATTTSIINSVGCSTAGGLTAKTGAVSYPKSTQAVAADLRSSRPIPVISG